MELAFSVFTAWMVLKRSVYHFKTEVALFQILFGKSRLTPSQTSERLLWLLAGGWQLWICCWHPFCWCSSSSTSFLGMQRSFITVLVAWEPDVTPLWLLGVWESSTNSLTMSTTGQESSFKSRMINPSFLAGHGSTEHILLKYMHGHSSKLSYISFPSRDFHLFFHTFWCHWSCRSLCGISSSIWPQLVTHDCVLSRLHCSIVCDPSYWTSQLPAGWMQAIKQQRSMLPSFPPLSWPALPNLLPSLLEALPPCSCLWLLWMMICWRGTCLTGT